jgi:hypothetical protein
MGGTHTKYHTGLHFTNFVYFLMSNIFICLFSWDDYEGYLQDGDQTKGFRISGFLYSHHSCMLGHSNQGVKGRIGGTGSKGTFFAFLIMIQSQSQGLFGTSDIISLIIDKTFLRMEEG